MSRKCLFFGEPTGNRTQDLRIKSPVLYQLSYRLYSGLYLRENTRFVHPSQDSTLETMRPSGTCQ